MATGKIIRFDEIRGYGFIAPDAGGEDVFVHANALLGDKHLFGPGVSVEFDAVRNDRGAKAITVRLLRNVTVASHSADSASGASAASDLHADDVCDVLSTAMFVRELTEVMIDSSPTLTAAQITQLRQSLLTLASRHGWIED